MDNVNTLTGGMDKDSSPIKQSEHTTNFVLNGIYNEFDGELGSIQNEPGNEECFSLPEGYNILGHVNMGNEEVLILSLNRVTSKSGIGVAKNCSYTHLVDTTCLGFDTCHMIKGKYRNIKGCGRTVYLYDALNYDLSINLDDLEKYTQTYEETDPVTGITVTKNYTPEEANALNKWDCNEMRLEPEFLMPCIKDATVNDSGGQLHLGLWKFAIEILDSDQNSIGFGPISQGITIYDEDVASEWFEIDGGYNLSSSHTAEFGGVPVSNKAIRLMLTNLDTRFTYARIYAVVGRTGDGVTLEVIKKGDIIPITASDQTYTFTGFNIANGDTLEPLETLTALKERYIASKAMEFVDKRLVRYNLTKEITDWSFFQRAASRINTEFVWKNIRSQNKNLGDPKHPLTTFKRMSEMGDEVTAWAIVFGFRQGFYSPPFHIPGRCANEYDTQEVFAGTETKTIPFTITDIQQITNPDGSIEIRLNYSFGTEIQDLDFSLLFGFESNNNPIGQIGADEGYISFIYPPGTPNSTITMLTIHSNQGSVGSDSVTIPINPNNPADIISSFQINQITTTTRWKEENTAQVTGSQSGIMGYHQCEATYPDIRDCNGESIWGTDSCGNELIGTPIRHHRMPDRGLVPHYSYDDNKFIRPLGIRFSNISYPHPDIIEHHFVRVNRDDFTKTVLAAGHTTFTCSRAGDQRVIFTSAWTPYHQLIGSLDRQDTEFLSPDIKVKSKIENGNHLNVNHKVRARIVHETSLDNIYEEASKKYGGDDLFIGNRIIRAQNLSIFPVTQKRLEIEENKLMNALSKSTGAGKDVINLLWDNKVNYIRTSPNTNFFPTAPIYDRKDMELQYCYIKRDGDVYCNLDSLIYYRTHSCAFYGSQGSFEIYGGDTFIVYTDFIRSWLSDVDPNQTNGIWVVIGIVIAAVLTIVTYGAASPLLVAIIAAAGITAVTAASVIAENIQGLYSDCTLDPFIKGDDPGIFGDGYVLFISELVDNLYSESEVNFDLRHSGSGDLTNKFSDFRTSPNSYVDDLDRYYKVKYTIDNDELKDDVEVRDIMLPELYWYNRDFNLLKGLSENTHIPIPQTYDYCDDCDEREPNAVIWSERAFDEETADAMRIFLPLNKTNIGNHAGEITNAKFDRNRMLVTTENSVFFISPNPRVLQADEDDIHTGLGDFLSIPEQEYVKVDWGHGGNQGRFNAVQSEFGWTYADQQNGEILNYTNEGIQSLTKGLTQWFKEELPNKLINLLEEHNIEHTCKEALTNINGLGLQGVYDPRYKRYILHKTDFLPRVFDGLYTGGLQRPGFYYFPDRNVWVEVINGDGLEKFIPLGDPDYFTNESWTISYSYAQRAWVSYHSYQPSYMFNNGDTFFTFNFDETSWKHVDRNFTTYYGDKYDFIVDYTINNLPTEDLQALHWYSRSKTWDVNNKRWIDTFNKTFDKMLIYNSNQSTGEQNLIYLDKDINPYGNRIGWSNTEKDVILTEKDYKVSAIRDLSIAQPSITSNFDYLADQFNQSDSNRQGYIDLVSFTDNIDTDKSEYDLADMKDKYHLIRLYFTKENTEDIKVIMDIINSRTYLSIH